MVGVAFYTAVQGVCSDHLPLGLPCYSYNIMERQPAGRALGLE